MELFTARDKIVFLIL